MACTVGFWHFRNGDSLTLELRPLAGGDVANTGGDSLVESGSSTFYIATISEDLAGDYVAKIRRGEAVIYVGLVRITGTAQYVIDAGGVDVVNLEQTALAQLAGTRQIHITVPSLCGTQLSQPIVRGDSYLAEHDRAIDFSRSDFPDLPEGSTVTLSARQVECKNSESFSWTGSIVVATGAKVVRFEPTSEETAGYTPGKYEFNVEVLFPDGNSATFVGPRVYLQVIGDVTVS